MEMKQLFKKDNLIVMVCHEYPADSAEIQFWGGMGSVTQAISERLVLEGFEVLVLPRRVKEYAAKGVFYLKKNGVHILSLPIQAYQAGPQNADLYNIYPIKEGLTSLDHCYTAWRFLERHKIKDPTIHLHDWLSVGMAREAKRANFRSIFTVHMSGERIPDNIKVDKRLELERITGNYADKVHYVSLAQRRSCKIHRWSLSKKHSVIPNGCDIDRYIPPKETPIEDYVLFVGRLSPVKNVGALVKGWSIFNKQYPEVKLKILGASGISNVNVQMTINALNSIQKNKVNLRIEMIPEIERIKYYQNSAVCCFPSSKEAFGIVALEAQSCGKPVVVGDVGGFKENVLEGVTGVHVRGNEPKSIAEGLATAYENRESWGKNARKLVLSFYSWDKIIKDYIEQLYSN